MTSEQEYYGENTRWIVKETYFGKFDDTRTLCACHSLSDARIIIDAMVKARKGRTFEFKAEKVADDYIEVCDAIREVDILTGETCDYSNYVNGISSL